MSEALNLLTKAAAQFRYYEANHRLKATKLAGDSLAEHSMAVDVALLKAEANAGFATEIEEFLETAEPTTSAISRPELLNLLRTGHDEIVTLRRKVDVLEPKAHAYDTIAIHARIANTEPPTGWGVDVAWQLKGAVEQLVAERESERVEDIEAS